LLGYENLEVINPEGGEGDAEEEARRGRWKQEVSFFLLKIWTSAVVCLLHMIVFSSIRVLDLAS